MTNQSMKNLKLQKKHMDVLTCERANLIWGKPINTLFVDEAGMCDVS